MSKVALKLKVEGEQWEVLREAIIQFSEQFPLLKRNEYHLLLICEEWFLNIVNHGFPTTHPIDKTKSEVEFEMSYEDSETTYIKIMFKDGGIPFNPFDHINISEKTASIEQALGGLGLYFIVNLLRKYEYSYINNKNYVVMEYELK